MRQAKRNYIADYSVVEKKHVGLITKYSDQKVISIAHT